jgi:tyrosine aminotransferase
MKSTPISVAHTSCFVLSHPGHKHVRDAIAAKYSHDNLPLTASDVFVTSGCSGAVQVAMHAVACKGENVLLPQPGFSLYHTLAGNAEIESRSYQCLPNQRWEIDLKNMDALVDEKTRAIVVNNPGNPCGSNYSREHLEAVAAFAQKHQLVVIADEVYGRMVFPGEEFVSFASVTTDVPVITTAGLAKMYCVPGWRVGWAVVHDKHERMGAIRDGMQNLCSVLLGANTIAQSIVPSFLNDTPESYFATQQATLYENAQAFYGAVSEIDGLNPIKPQGGTT